MFYPEASRMLRPVRTIAPTAFFLAIDELQVHLRVDSDFDYDYVSSLMQVASALLDGWSGILNLCLINQTWTASWDSFPWRTWFSTRSEFYQHSPSTQLRLPLAPVQSVVVTYYDTNNVQQTFSSANYGLYSDGRGWFIQLNQNQSWPTTYSRPDAVTVTMVVGYGATASSVPYPIRHAAKMLITNWYENRMSVGSMTTEADVLLAPYKRNWVH